MNIESQKFKFKNIENLYIKSKEVKSNRQASANITDSIESLDAICKNCNHSWFTGKHDKLSFEQFQNNLIITCPNCREYEEIDINVLREQ